MVMISGEWTLLLAFYVIFVVHITGADMFSMISHDSQFLVDAGRTLSLRCEFYKTEFSLFENPAQWKKTQYGEESEVNLMSYIKEPFSSTGRFRVSYENKQPRYTLGLEIDNVSPLDTANYTCEIRGPKSTELGVVRYQVFIKAPVDNVFIVPGNASYANSYSSVTSITFVENEPTPIRCIARGGSPPPEMRITVGGEDYSKYFRFDSMPSVSGTPGFRNLQMTAMMVTDNFRTTARDHGKTLECIAKVSGLETEKTSQAIISVHYAPRIDCRQTTAYVGQTNVDIVCNISAVPKVTSWSWVIDNNGTTIVEGEFVNGFWSYETDEPWGLQLQLYRRLADEDTFGNYTLRVENPVAARSATVWLKRKYRESKPNPHTNTDEGQRLPKGGGSALFSAAGSLRAMTSLLTYAALVAMVTMALSKGWLTC